MSTSEPFRLDIPQADLDDLADRLALTRWPDELPGAGWDYGVARDRVRQLAAYWRQGYDWHAWAARLNAVPQFTTIIDGQKIHFLHARGGAGLPLLLCHGWPSTPADFPGDATIRRFAEAQHNVARWTEFERGGHFAALLAPDLLERDLREFFTGLR